MVNNGWWAWSMMADKQYCTWWSVTMDDVWSTVDHGSPIHSPAITNDRLSPMLSTPKWGRTIRCLLGWLTGCRVLGVKEPISDIARTCDSVHLWKVHSKNHNFEYVLFLSIIIIVNFDFWVSSITSMNRYIIYAPRFWCLNDMRKNSHGILLGFVFLPEGIASFDSQLDSHDHYRNPRRDPM